MVAWAPFFFFRGPLEEVGGFLRGELLMLRSRGGMKFPVLRDAQRSNVDIRLTKYFWPCLVCLLNAGFLL